MADPVVHITNGIPDLGTGNITTLGQTLADGANATLGAIADSAIVAGAAGTINAHLRSISRDIAGGIVIQSGVNNIGSVSQGGAPWSQNVSQFGGAAVVTGTGISGAGIPRVTVSSDSSLAATQSGSWDLRNITGSVPLPTGAATSAKQPAPGTAGSPSADVITVQGIGGMTAVKVDGTGGTFPVSGTLAATQSGTWNITNVSGTVSLPTGAATAAKQPAPSTAGSPSADVLTVQGASGMTALKTNIFGNSGGTLDFAGQNASGSINSQLVGGQYNTSPSTITTGNYSPLQLDSSGNLLVNVKAGGASGGTSSSFGSAFPSTGTAIGAKDSTGTNMVAMNLDASGNLKVNVAAGGASGGTSSSFGAAIPGTGTADGWSDGTNMQMPRVFDGDSGAGTQYIPGALLKKPASGGAVDFGTSSDPIRIDPVGTTAQPVTGTFWQATQPVSGTFWQATQPVSGTITANQGGAPWTIKPDGTAWGLTGTSANVNLTNSSVAVTGTFWQATQPVSAASLPLPSGAATSALQPTNVGIGSTTSGQTGNLAFGAVTTGAPTYTTGQSDPLSLTTAGALRIDGSGATQPVSGSVTVTQSTAGNLKVDLSGTAANATAIKVDGSSVTQPVSGTVSAAQSGTWTVQPGNTANTTPWLVLPKGFQDSGGTDITDTTNHALKVNIVAGAGSGGTASTFGSAFPSQGTAIGVKDSTGTNMTFLQTNASNALKVDGSAVTQPVSGTFWQATQPVSGTVTANQGGTWNVTNISGTISLPSGAATSAAQPTNAALGSTTSGQTGNLALGAVTSAAPSYTTATSNSLSLTTAGALRTDASATTQPVSGTFWQATQPVSGTFWQATQPVSIAAAVTVAQSTAGNLLCTASQGGTWNINNISGTISLPTGAATAALQPSNAAQGSTTSGQTGNLAMGAVTTGNPTYTTGQTSPLSLDTSGAVRVNVIAGSGGGGTSSSFGSAFPATGTASGANVVSSTPSYTAGNMNGLTMDTGGNLRCNITTGAVSITQGGNTALVNPSGSLYTNIRGGASGSQLDFQGQNAGGSFATLTVGGQYNTTPSTIANGNWSPLQLDTNGNLLVNVKAGGGSGGGTSMQDATAFTAATTQFTPAGGFYQTTATANPLTTGQAGAWQMTAQRAGFVNLRSSAGVEIASFGSPAYVDITNVTSSNIANWTSATGLNTVAYMSQSNSLGHNSFVGQITTPSTLTAGAITFEESFDAGTTWKSVPVGRVIDPSTGLQLSNPFTLTASLTQPWQIVGVGLNYVRARLSTVITGTGNTVIASTIQAISSEQIVYQPVAANLKAQIDPLTIGNWGLAASTQNVATPTNGALVMGEFNTTPTTIASGNSSPLQMDSGGNLKVTGEVAAGATDAGNPQKFGGLAKTTNPTAVSDGQRVNALFDKLGKQIAVGAVRDLKAVQTTTITAATETTVVTAGAAGVFNDVYGIICSNTSATAVNVAFKDATAGTTRMTLQVPAGDVRGFTVDVGSAMVQATAAANWTATVSSAVTSILVTMLYVKNT